MIDIQLQAIANQSLTIPLEGDLYAITIKETNGCMSATVTRSGVTLVNNVRIVGDGFILPYGHMLDGKGNFFISVQDGDVPYFDQFGLIQFLVYITAAELAAL